MNPQWRMARTLNLAALVFGIALITSCGSDASSSQQSSVQSADRSVQGGPQTVDATTIISQKLSLTIRLPGEITPYESVAEFPKVTAFVKWIGIDRGSRVKAGQEIVRLEAPELVAEKQEADSKLQAAGAQRAEAEAKLTSDQSTLLRRKTAAATRGVVVG